ncbi:MAG: cytochrome b/b6 domain-containing protein [Pseudomonadota bacterium]
MSRKVRAFSPIQRFYHRHLIYLMFFFILTGLPILSDSFHWIAYVFSFPFNFLAENNGELLSTGLQVCRSIHRIAAVLLILITIPFALAMLVKLRHWQMWPERWGIGATLDGLKELKKNYLDYGHARFGKYNIGQKAAFWAFLFGIIAITLSGFILWFRALFSQGLVDAMRITHDIAFVVVVLTLVMHIYFAIFPRNRYGLDAMFGNGLMDEHTVREHHELWYEKIKGDRQTFE